MNEKRFVIKSTATELELYDNDVQIGEFPHSQWVAKSVDYVVDLLNELSEENEKLKNELKKEKSLREYSDSMYDKDMFVNIRFRNGKWKVDVSVIEDE